ncbi:MAG: nucleotidyltransferase domain-containing protein [Actinomycetota bacterium]
MREAERQLLLAAARRSDRWDGEAQLDWDSVARAAAAHGITSLVLRYVEGAAPEPALKRLRGEAQSASRRSLLLVSRLQAILERFEAASVPVLLYKGPALAVQAYGQLALRPFVDLDLLVRPRDVERATATLIALGYEAFPKLTPARRRSYLRSECECWFDVPDGTSPVEVHWAVRERLYNFPMDVEGIFARAASVTLCGRPVLTMAPEDLLLTLCIHGAKHGWSQLKWICDLDRIIAAHPNLDWGALFAHARLLRGERLLLFGLSVTAGLLGTELPSLAQSRLTADATPAKLANETIRNFWLAGEAPGGASTYLRSREDLRDRFSYCYGMLTTPTLADWEALPLPDALFPLYYVHRPLRLAAERVRSLLTPRAGSEHLRPSGS